MYFVARETSTYILKIANKFFHRLCFENDVLIWMYLGAHYFNTTRLNLFSITYKLGA